MKAGQYRRSFVRTDREYLSLITLSVVGRKSRIQELWMKNRSAGPCWTAQAHTPGHWQTLRRYKIVRSGQP